MRRQLSHTCLFSLLYLLGLWLWPAHESLAQEVSSEVDKEAKNIYASVMSPFCPGRLLSDCPSSAADQLKQEIRQDLASGVSPEEVISSLYSKYGDQMRAQPKGEGFGLLGWGVPVVFLVGGVVFILLWIRGQAAERSVEPD